MNKDAEQLCEVRDYLPEDRPFIIATFLRGLYYGDSWFSQIPKDVFMSNYQRVATAMVDSPHTVVKVACLKDDNSVIVGYSMLSADYTTIHWVYVKKAFRSNGIGRSLVPQRPEYVTHLTSLGRSLIGKFEHCIFDPFRIGGT